MYFYSVAVGPFLVVQDGEVTSTAFHRRVFQRLKRCMGETEECIINRNYKVSSKSFRSSCSKHRRRRCPMNDSHLNSILILSCYSEILGKLVSVSWSLKDEMAEFSAVSPKGTQNVYLEECLTQIWLCKSPNKTSEVYIQVAIFPVIFKYQLRPQNNNVQKSSCNCFAGCILHYGNSQTWFWWGDVSGTVLWKSWCTGGTYHQFVPCIWLWNWLSVLPWLCMTCS